MQRAHRRVPARLLCALAIAAALAVPQGAAAQTTGVATAADEARTRWQVRSETTAHAYRYLDAQRRPIDRFRFSETLGLVALTELPQRGGAVVTRVLLRLEGDPSVDQREADALGAIQPTRFDLLGASVAGHGLGHGVVDFELGRFVRLDSLGFAMLDGAAIDLSTPWHFGVGIHGGLEPTETRDALTWNPFRLDGFTEREDEPLVFLYGASLFTRQIGLHAARVDFRRWEDADGDLRAQQIAASLRLAFPGVVFVDGDARYDLIGKVLGDLRGRALVPLTARWELEARYDRTVPIFDTASIFSIFPLFPIQRGSLGARFRYGRSLMITARASLRVVQDGRDPDLEPGAYAGLNWRGERLDVLVDAEHFSGATATWDHLQAQVAWPFFGRRLWVRGGLMALWADDSVSPELNAFSYGAHAEARYRFAEGWEARIYVEDHESRLEKHAVRALLSLQAALGGGGE